MDNVVELYSDMIYRLAYSRTQNKADAEDITQEVFLKYIRAKKKYDEADESIMPLYNVSDDENFDIPFCFSSDDVTEYVDSYASVHTAPSCSQQNMMYTYNYENTSADGKLIVTVAPVAGVLATDSEDYDVLENDHATWGNAPIYYLAIWYDMESETPVKLKKPVVIPFTVKHDTAVPDVKGTVDSQGRFKLSWEPVDGATEYKISSLVGENQTTGTRNDPVKGAEYGYSDSLIIDEVTTETEFDSFAGDNSHSLAIHEISVSDRTYVLGQNYSVCGEYYVSAVVNGKETGLSAGISTSDLKIPYETTDECDIMFKSYKDTSQLPLTLDVVNIDGSVTKRNVLYTFQWETTYEGTKTPEYKYEIDGNWYQTDTTNNEVTMGIAYFLYNSDSDTAQQCCFTISKILMTVTLGLMNLLPQ